MGTTDRALWDRPNPLQYACGKTRGAMSGFAKPAKAAKAVNKKSRRELRLDFQMVVTEKRTLLIAVTYLVMPLRSKNSYFDRIDRVSIARLGGHVNRNADFLR